MNASITWKRRIKCFVLRFMKSELFVCDRSIHSLMSLRCCIWRLWNRGVLEFCSVINIKLLWQPTENARNVKVMWISPFTLVDAKLPSNFSSTKGWNSKVEVLIFVITSSWQRAIARNVRWRNSLPWPIYIINSVLVDKTKLPSSTLVIKLFLPEESRLIEIQAFKVRIPNFWSLEFKYWGCKLIQDGSGVSRTWVSPPPIKYNL